jgi:general secretion pathway protein A
MGLKRPPFPSVPDFRELFQSRGHQELRARVQIALTDRIPGLFLGKSGVGKSTSIRSALVELDKRTYRLIEISDPRLNRRSLYRSVATGLGLDPSHFFGDLTEQVRAALAQTTEGDSAGRHPVAFVDNVEMLSDDALDSLRLMTNPSLGQNLPGLTLILVGDMSMSRRLKKPRFESFVQRLRMTYCMPAIDDDEGRRYVAHRVRVAGGNPDIFDPAAVESVLREANGRLRMIDDLASQALYAAFISKATVVTKEHVQSVIGERALGV